MQKFKRVFPGFQNFFPFGQFNRVQEQCLGRILNETQNMIVSAPTSSGKTVIFELCIIKQLLQAAKQDRRMKCLYIAPIKSLCHQKDTHWKKTFGSQRIMNGQPLKIYELTGDNTESDSDCFEFANIVIATPQKIDYFSRQFLKSLMKIDLLLIDEIHMLNFEERGATLEAVINRIMILNQKRTVSEKISTNEQREKFQLENFQRKTRIVAVSATIPNIGDVAEWLKVPKHLVMTFGEQYRPVKLKKVVLGFYGGKNAFTFEKSLNYKLLNVIREYSQNKGTIVFCQTQKGTESACQQLVNDMLERQFINDNNHLQDLAKAIKMFDNSNLGLMVGQGVAFHNASLSMQDRSLVQKLFLQQKIKVLCTTSTLSMGVNLPARLVVIKSTKVYRGSGKGYEEYTKIQIDQMAGRAGRIPFDREGTVVIMTEKSNYNKYNNSMLNGKNAQLLESQLAPQLVDHLNTQISLKSITSIQDVYNYFYNSFCYIRIKKSPFNYGLKSSSSQAVKNYVQASCKGSVQKLVIFDIVDFTEKTGSIIPKQLSTTIAKNHIQVDTVIDIITQSTQYPEKSARKFLLMLSKAKQIQKIRSKNQERTLLKQLDLKNKYALKEAISTSDKKAFVLVQAHLSKINIENWQMKRQASDIVYVFKRINYCVSKIGYERKLFWISVWSAIFNKYFNEGFWEQNSQNEIIKQIKGIRQKYKNLAAKGIDSIDKILQNIHLIDSICQKGNNFSKQIKEEIINIKQSISISFQKKDDALNCRISFKGTFSSKMKFIKVLMCDCKQSLYASKFMNESNKQVVISISLSYHAFWGPNCYLAIIKDGYIGFDQIYSFNKSGALKFLQMEQMSKKLAQQQLRVSKQDKKKQRRKTLQQQKPKRESSPNSDQYENSRNSLQNKQLSLDAKYQNLKMIGNKNSKQESLEKKIFDEQTIQLPVSKKEVKKNRKNKQMDKQQPKLSHLQNLNSLNKFNQPYDERRSHPFNSVVLSMPLQKEAIKQDTNYSHQKYQRHAKNKFGEKKWQEIPFDQSSNKKLKDFGWQKRFSEQEIQNKKYLRIAQDQQSKQRESKSMGVQKPTRHLLIQTQSSQMGLTGSDNNPQFPQYQYKATNFPAKDKKIKAREHIKQEKKQGIIQGKKEGKRQEKREDTRQKTKQKTQFKNAYDYFANLF